MKTSTKFAALVLAMIGPAAVSPAAFAQQESAQLATNGTGPVAYVYVSSYPTQTQTQINAYAADRKGSLKPVPGSPFVENGSTLAVGAKWLFSSDTVNIYSFSIAPNGALKQVSSINAQAYNGYADGGPISLFLDRTRESLYDLDIYGNIGANNTYQFFDIDRSNGSLSYVGATSTATPNFETPLSFVGNNQYGYGGGCYHGDQALYGFSRSESGALTDLNLNPPFPTAQDGAYCPYIAVSDGRNHLAVSLSPNNDMTPTGPTQLAVYTVDSSGTLTTTSTYQNMPVIGVTNLEAMSMSPSGKLLAVAGSGGVEVYHFNGANPITAFTGLLTSDAISQVYWDNSHHLYAISPTSGELFVFTVTPDSYEQSPGSPYAIANPYVVVVRPKP
jgi:hypothetical protein